MIGYSDTTFPASLHTPGSPPKSPSPILEQHRINPGADKRGAIQLTPLWEHVVRTQSVPKDVNLDDIFMALNDRLRDPEWEVRQHALRVLVDVIPVMDDTLDQKMEILLGDLVGNLGHPGPAVRKGALDSLKMYLTHSSHSDDILRNIVFRGVDTYSDNQLQSDVVVGIILSLPSLIFPGVTKDNTTEYIVKSLINKLIQVTFQEVALRSLVRIREIIGPDEFNRIIDQTESRRDFELLCQVYETHSQKPGFNYENKEDDRSKWNDLNANIINDNRWNSDSDSVGILSQDENSKTTPKDNKHEIDEENNVPAGKVILETEIQFNSSTAVTMKILEERDKKSNESDSDEDNRDCVVKVLSDSDNEENFELRRRTPRRVRFGGEIVKLRTPDSDSNHPSDADDITITTSPSSDPNSPVIEIKFVTDDKKASKRQSRSLIPVPVTPVTQKPKARSLPSSPNRKIEPNSKTKSLYQSHPNLTRTHFFNDKTKPKTKNSNPNNLKVQIPKRKSSYISRSPSPILPHREIELFHNLTRSPTRDKPEPNFEIKVQETKPKEHPKKLTERKLTTADSITHNVQLPKPERSISTADSTKPKPKPGVQNTSSIDSKSSIINEPSFNTDLSDNDSTPARTFSSFILKDSASEGIQSDSCVTNVDNGDCLTCSSSGSEGVQIENSWETAGIIDKAIIEDMHDKEDLRTKLKGFETFSIELKKSETLRKIQPFLNSLLHFLFSAERNPRLQNISEEMLKNVLKNSSAENLKLHLPQIAMSLSKMGSPAGVRLGIITMQNLSARNLVQHIVEEPLMSSRSAKTREGAMQLLVCATTTFPSTEFDISTMSEKVSLVATDRKRRVRQATLDVLAVLAQLGQPSIVLEAVAKSVKDLPDRDRLLAAVRARLSRRQLPMVEADGTIINASPGIGHGADVDWVAAGSGSMSPCSARSRRRAMTPATSSSSSQSRNESTVTAHKNMWSARKFQEPTETNENNDENSDDVTWALVPYNKKDESQNKIYPGQQLWTLEQQNSNIDNGRFSTSTGTLRPVYLLQAQQPQAASSFRIRQTVNTETIQTEHRTPHSQRNINEQRKPSHYTRGRSSSPPLRLVQIKGATRTVRGQSSSPPEFANRRVQNSGVRRAFATDVSSDSSQSIKSSPPRTNWRREFQSAIPVPVSGEISRSRFRRRFRDSEQDMSASQPMIALPRHYPLQQLHNHHHQNGGGIGSAPVVNYSQRKSSRTKSPSPTHFSVDKFSVSQDSGINHQSSSGSESSDYYTPPAEPYLPLQPSEPPVNSANPREDSSDHTDRSDTPPAPISEEQNQQPQNRERFINLEDHESTSDFDENDDEKKTSDLDETDFVRSQVYQKLHEEHINVSRDPPFRENIGEKRLSKSHADLSEVKKFTRKTISSAPLVKHLKDLENGLENRFNNNITLDEESRTSINSSTIELKSISQNDIRSMNSQTDLQIIHTSQMDLRSMSSSQGNLSQNQLELRSLSQKDLRTSQPDLQNFNNSQSNLQFPDDDDDDDNGNEPEEKTIKYPEIIRKKSLPAKPKIELKRRSSNIPTKVHAIFTDGLRNFPKPREGLSEVISQLESPEWEQSIKGLQGLVRLIRHHQDTVESQLHSICVLLGRHVKNLRSQVARAACSAAAEMFVTHKKGLEMELEELTVPLLQRTADTNKFLRADANSALDAMCLNMSTSRAVTVLTMRGATHHNAVVRCATARLLNDLVHRLGANRVYQLPRDIRDKILAVGANMLMEGSLETRKHAKSMFLELSNHPNFQRSLSEAVTATTLRNISKQLSNLK